MEKKISHLPPVNIARHPLNIWNRSRYRMQIERPNQPSTKLKCYACEQHICANRVESSIAMVFEFVIHNFQCDTMPNALDEVKYVSEILYGLHSHATSALSSSWICIRSFFFLVVFVHMKTSNGVCSEQ